MISKFIYYIYFYYILSKSSFENIDLWLKELKANANPDVKVYLVGNKSDLEEKRLVQKELAEKFKSNFDLDMFMECSAKTGFNAQSVFIEATKMLYREYVEYRNTKTSSFIVDDSSCFDGQSKNKRIVISDDIKENSDIPKKKNCC